MPWRDCWVKMGTKSVFIIPMMQNRYLKLEALLGGNPKFDCVLAFSLSFISMMIFVSVCFWLIMWLVDTCGVYFWGNVSWKLRIMFLKFCMCLEPLKVGDLYFCAKPGTNTPWTRPMFGWYRSHVLGFKKLRWV